MIRSSPAHVGAHVRRLASRGVVTVAIDGYSGSGKSTLAGRLAPYGGATVVTADDFYRVMDDAVRRELAPEEAVARYFDWERLRDEALAPLRSGLRARYRPYDWATGGRLARRTVQIPPAPGVVVDGVYSARPELAAFVDLSVLVDTPRSLRAQRLAERGDDDGWNARWDVAEQVYFTVVRPPESFDLVVTGS